MKQFAKEQHVFYLDYYSSLVDERGGMRTGTSKDGVHPNSTGYGIMAPLAEGAIAVVLTAATP